MPSSILIIEDSDTVRNFLRRSFEREIPACQVSEAVDGRSALSSMGKARADLIVTDLQMPGMDGRSFIAKLRSNPLLRKKSVIVLSSDDLSDLKALYQGDAGIRFFSKPCPAAELVEAARQLLSSGNAQMQP
jgi:two-component system chemotaxis response regulator CheY